MGIFETLAVVVAVWGVVLISVRAERAVHAGE
jgi:hypothetical protein